MDQAIESESGPGVTAGRARGGRASQQDDLLCAHDPASQARLLVLADGMGGDGAGELASAGVIAVARTLWDSGVWREQPGALFLEQLCQDAHLELRRRGEGLAVGEPHSTVVALLLRDSRAYWAHVGDSRLYRFQDGRLLGCTEDHSLVQARVRRGELEAAEAAHDADQHMLLRGLGGAHTPQVDHGCAELQPGQTFALCSDGIWEHLSGEELARFAGRRDQGEALNEALTLALARGGVQGDNVSLILVRALVQRQGRGAIARFWGRLLRGQSTAHQ